MEGKRKPNYNMIKWCLLPKEKINFDEPHATMGFLSHLLKGVTLELSAYILTSLFPNKLKTHLIRYSIPP